MAVYQTIKREPANAAATYKTVTRLLGLGTLAVVVTLAIAAGWLIWGLPDGQMFSSHVEEIFVAHDEFDSEAEVQLLEILASSGAYFSGIVASYRGIILVLIVFAACLLIATLTLLVYTYLLNRRVELISKQGIEVNSLQIRRDDNMVGINDLELTLTPSAIETLSLLAEARLDDEILNGIDIEAVISGRNADECNEASGAMRIKRLRDTLGNQLVSEILVKSIARQGYVLNVQKNAIRIS